MSGQYVGFVVDKAVLGQVFLLSASVFPANHSTNFPIIIITRAGTMAQ
jgi:hypothetical protein